MDRTTDHDESVTPLSNWSNGTLIGVGLVVLSVVVVGFGMAQLVFKSRGQVPKLLTDPFLQSPTDTSVQVVWFTEFPGTEHWVDYGDDVNARAIATTTQLSRTREDQDSHIGTQAGDGTLYEQVTPRPIWRHEATIPNLESANSESANSAPSNAEPFRSIPYRVTSTTKANRSVTSDIFTLQPLPQAGDPLNILLTSDHQLMPMTPANIQAVGQTVDRIDAVFLAGDLVNIPDRASEWFDDSRGRAFFPALQGRSVATLDRDDSPTRTYRGGALIQSAPLFPAIGNHEVMGRWSMEASLKDQFNDPVPRAIASQRYQKQAKTVNPTNDPGIANTWVTHQSFNSITYDEIFSLPQNEQGHSRYYAITVGDVRLVVLYATNIWRSPKLGPGTRGRYREADEDLHDESRWGYGQHIFEPIGPGSAQYDWLQAEVRSPEFKGAKYTVVMFHHPPHSLGDNIVPAYTDPVQTIDRFDDDSIKAVRYEYPKGQDYLMRDVMPLLESAGVDLVFFGHSHLWNRFTSDQGTHFLESSNVGNTYGAYWRRDSQDSDRRPIPIGYTEEYEPWGDPNGLLPITPTIAPVLDDSGQPQPFIASNDLSVFSILNTGTGTVSSYRFDTRTPDQPAVKFDEFSLD